MKLPAIRLKGGGVLILVALAAAALAIAGVHKVSFLNQVERTVEDFRTTFMLKSEPTDPNIVIIGIEESTLALFPYREPVDRGFLADLLALVASRNPRAIGVDILFDQETEPEKDDRLRDVIAHIGVPLVISYWDNPDDMNDDQLAFLNNFVPVRDRVQATLPEDPLDSKVRKIPGSKVMRDGHRVPGFARGLLLKLGKEVPDGETTLVWHGAPDRQSTPFTVYPAERLKILPPAFANLTDKIVLIGGYFTLRDRHRTPFANSLNEIFAKGENMDVSTALSNAHGEFPGIEIHAHAVAQFLEDRQPRDLNLPQEILLVLAFAVIGTLLGAVEMATTGRYALAVLFLAALWVTGFKLANMTGITIKLIEPSIALLVATWASDAIQGAQAKRQRAFINSAFSLYLSPQMVKQLQSDPDKLQLGGEMRDMTIFFCDIRGFTTISEKFDAQGLTRFINNFLTPMTDLILANQGTIDKYMGDAIMAFWNAPMDDPDHALHGCIAALKMREKLDSLNVQWKAEADAAGHPFIEVHIGMGLNSGTCCVGNVGSDQRLAYSVLGDDVNLASRLEGQSKTYGVDIVIGENTRAKVPQLATLELDSIKVKGKTRPVVIFTVLGDEAMAQTEEFQALRKDHETMLAAYRKQDWKAAIENLEACRDRKLPLLAGLYTLYEERIASYVAAPPPADWDGVYVALTK